ncbi:MAG: DUF2800 domain-containing protein [Firmicutes bacterium]|nr:DUF2800 domain-containing protein [Bacillota bacterium]
MASSKTNKSDTDIIQKRLEKIVWSYSRREIFEQCPRRYYYEYYGSSKRSALSDPEKTNLRHLKGMQNRYQRAGTILHLVISTYLRHAQKGNNWSLDRLINWSSKILRSDRLYSNSDPDGKNPIKEKYPPILLREYHYRQKDVNLLYSDIEERLNSAIESFLKATVFSEFRDAGALPGALIEQNLRLQSLPCKVTGKLDLAYNSDRSITIVDWKLGASDGTGEDSLQLASYALWAIDNFGHTAETIRICKAYLQSEEIIDYKINDNVIRAANLRIQQDVERFILLHNYGDKGIRDAFTPCSQPGICSLCNFQILCPEGRLFLDA